MYQGHLPAGNPVQRHSAGDHYPYVIEVWESTVGPVHRYWGVIGPNLSAACYFAREDEAEAFARNLSRPQPVTGVNHGRMR